MEFKTRHFGFKVKNLKESLDYFKKNGYKIFYDKEEYWEEFGKLKIIKLKKKETPDIELVKTDSKNYQGHLCFEVQILNDFYKKFKNKYDFIVKPRVSIDKKVKICFYKHNNILYEVVEVL